MHRSRYILGIIICTLMFLVASSPAFAADDVLKDPISFTVSNPLDPGSQYTVRGHIFRPATDSACQKNAILLVHGLNYGEWLWDFPQVTSTDYSVARALARDGFNAIAIDLPGYGSSDHPNGKLLTIPSYAAMTDQIISAIRADGYQHVGLMGHSAGTMISETAQALYGSADFLIATAAHQFPSPMNIMDVSFNESPRALLSDYIYYGGNPTRRAGFLYYSPGAEQAVINTDNSLANLTPSGEILSLALTPPVELINVPTLLLFAQQDVLFQSSYATLAKASFVSSPDMSMHLVPNAGHTFMLHENAAETNAVITNWLASHTESCSVN